MKSLSSIRPFQIVLLGIFVVLAFVGLFLFSNFTGFGNSANKIGTVVIWGTLPSAAVQNELTALQTADKSYAKVSYVQQDPSTFDNDLANAIASGDGPDLVIISQEQLVDEQNKLSLIPFSSIPLRTFRNEFVPEFDLYLTSQGTYGIPYVIDPMVLYYNKALFASAGIAQPPTSWEAVTGLAPTLTKQGASQTITQSTISFGSYGNVQNARGILSLLFLQAGNPITQTSTAGIRSALADSTIGADGTSAAEAVLNFYTQFADPTRTVYSWNASFGGDEQAFLANQLAMYVGFASEVNTLQASNPNLPFDMAPIPQPQTATQNVDYALAYAFAIPKASSNPKGAYATALALTSKNLLPAAATALSMAPAQSALLTPAATAIYTPIFYPEALYSEGWLSPSPPTTDSIFSTMITNITSGKFNVTTALESADQALTASLPSSQ